MTNVAERQEFDDETVVAPVSSAEPPQHSEESVTPSWFTLTYPNASQEDLAAHYNEEQPSTYVPPVHTPSPEAYEAYRRRIEERFQFAQRMADPELKANQDNSSFPARPALPNHMAVNVVRKPIQSKQNYR